MVLSKLTHLNRARTYNVSSNEPVADQSSTDPMTELKNHPWRDEIWPAQRHVMLPNIHRHFKRLEIYPQLASTFFRYPSRKKWLFDQGLYPFSAPPDYFQPSLINKVFREVLGLRIQKCLKKPSNMN